MASREAAALTSSIHAQQEKLAPTSVTMANLRDPTKPLSGVAPRANDTMDEQFPTTGLQAKSADDREIEARLKLSTAPGVTPFGRLEARDKDFKWLQEKQAAVEAANFQAWFAKEFDHMSPADKARAKQLYPEFYRQRKKLLKQQTKNLFELARIKIEGIQSKEDLVKVYLAESGRLDVGPLNHLLNPEDDLEKRSNEARFRRGLLSPFRVFGTEVVNNSGVSSEPLRKYEAGQFAKRTVPDATLKAGAYGVGVPPFTESNFNQGDVEWYNFLQGAGTPAAPAGP